MKEHHGLAKQFIRIIALAALESVLLLTVSQVVLAKGLRFWFSRTEVQQHATQKQVQERQSYVTEHHLASTDVKELTDWSHKRRYTLLELYRGQTMIYSSFAPKDGMISFLPQNGTSDQNPGVLVDKTGFYDWLPCYTLTFADGEVSVTMNETVRGSDVFIVQPTCKPVNNNLMELLVMIDALRRASAGRITAVIPYFGYARQDRKAKARDPISAKLVANMITAAGADRVLTMDLHASQIQGFFDIPVDNLLGNPIFVDYYAKKFGDKCEDMMVVSPDVGSVARARAFAQKLHMQLAIVDKRRQKANQCEVMNVIGDVKGKDCILFDDMVDTAGSLCNAAKAIVEVGGANKVYACASHGVLSGPAIDRLESSNIEELALLDTIPAHPEAVRARIKYLSVASMFSEAIERTYQEVSISKLFR